MQSRMNLEGCHLLLVEDEPVIALDIECELQRAGAAVCCVGSVKEASEFIERQRFTAAVVDYWLGDGTADDICSSLTERDVPFIVYSGVGKIQGACTKWGVVNKPAESSALVAKIIELLPPLEP